MVLGADGEKCGLIEIKGPYSCRNLTVLEACCSQQVKTFCCELVNDEIHLKRNHDYYCQIQGAMAITNMKWCDFIIWTKKYMNIERVKFDPAFWNTCYLKLKSIYSSHILPEIIGGCRPGHARAMTGLFSLKTTPLPHPYRCGPHY